MCVMRMKENPLLVCADVKPSRPDFTVVGVFNCGGVRTEEGVTLVCRVAEMCSDRGDDVIRIPHVETGGTIGAMEFNRSDPRYDFTDPRAIVERDGRRVAALSSMSSLRRAFAPDGVHFVCDDTPLFPLDPRSEEWGAEDPRITRLEDGQYAMTYSSVSRNGVGVSLALSDDLVTWNRQGMILPPANKDTVIFPKKIDGTWWMLHRPILDGLGASDIWIASSSDLVHWGGHQHLAGCRTGQPWEMRKIGAGAHPMEVDAGWLVLYHGVDEKEHYRVGALLLDKQDPRSVLARTPQPIFQPEEPYERNGFFSNTVFPCAAWIEGDEVVTYYGGADSCVCGARLSLSDIMDSLVYGRRAL